MIEPLRGTGGASAIGRVDFNTVQEHRGWFIGLGALFMILGLLAIIVPMVASVATAVFLGCLMVASGVFQGAHAVQNRGWRGSGWALLGAAIQVIAGALVLAFPVTGTITLTLVVGAYLFATGVLKILRALQHRAMAAWGFLLFDGILTIALGLLIALGWPSTAAWALGLLVGVDLLFSGSSVLLIGLSVPAPSRVRA
jgi:uncharacterized membrane protein HdeD (DUF308 family)